MKENLEKQEDNYSTYAFMSSSSNQNGLYSTNRQASKEITIENLVQNINSQLQRSKKKFQQLLCISPNLDQNSLELVNNEVLSFMGHFFGRTDLGIKYQEENKKVIEILKQEQQDQLLYKNFDWATLPDGKKTGGRKVDKSIGVFTQEPEGSFV